MSAGLSKARLRRMRDRWQRDCDALTKAYGDWMDAAPTLTTDAGSYIETMRNLETALAHIEGIINTRRKRRDTPNGQ